MLLKIIRFIFCPPFSSQQKLNLKIVLFKKLLNNELTLYFSCSSKCTKAEFEKGRTKA